MTLRELVRRALSRDLPPDVRYDPPIAGVAQASDSVVPGSLFVARPGLVTDGHAYAADAAERGAAAIAGERSGIDTLHGLPYLRLDDARADLAPLAAAFHGDPSGALTVVGVTGTDGKTTTAFLLHHLLSARFASGLVGTAGIRLRDVPLPLEGHFTSAEAPEVQALLARFRDAGLSHVVLESSSHGLALHRLDAVAYDLAVWTNLSPEHLDFHGDMAAYLAAKRLLVERAAAAVLNRDDPAYDAFADAAGETIPYGLHADAAWRAHGVQAQPGALRFALEANGERFDAELPMVGGYNVHNALAALAAADRLGLPPAETLPRLASFPGVPGRMQIVQREPFLVVVDFAHTPPALAKALSALRPLTSGRLIVAIGSAGERDPGKRAPLGRAAAEHADLAILTEEDHRSEPLAPILDAMAAGAEAAGAREGERYLRIGDRREAIREAVARARPGDTVVLAGKGHEATLERTDEVLDWDEVAEVEAALASLGMTPTD